MSAGDPRVEYVCLTIYWQMFIVIGSIGVDQERRGHGGVTTPKHDSYVRQTQARCSDKLQAFAYSNVAPAHNFSVSVMQLTSKLRYLRFDASSGFPKRLIWASL